MQKENGIQSGTKFQRVAVTLLVYRKPRENPLILHVSESSAQEALMHSAFFPLLVYLEEYLLLGRVQCFLVLKYFRIALASLWNSALHIMMIHGF